MNATAHLKKRHRRAHTPHKAPYWLQLPIWLQRRYRQEGRWRGVPRGALQTILHGQLALFQCIREQDDLFDGQARDLEMIYAADLHLLDSRRCFAKLFPKEQRFWREYWRCVEETVRGIVEVDRKQRRRGRMTLSSVGDYARVGAIFRVSSAAVCLLAKRESDYRMVRAYCNEMAMAGQISDDMQDIQEDKARGRHNVAGNTLARRSRSPAGPTRLLLQEMRRRLTRARSAIQPLRLPNADRQLARQLEALDGLDDKLHRHEVRHLLGALMECSSK